MRLLVVAGEVSGDQHASALLAALGARVPALEAFGVGGDGCRLAGMRLLAHQKDLAVVGLVEALAKLRFARRLIGSLAAEAVRQKADGAVLIDSPDFNLPSRETALSRRDSRRVLRLAPGVGVAQLPREDDRARSVAPSSSSSGSRSGGTTRAASGRSVTWVGPSARGRGGARARAARRAAAAAGARRVVLMPGSRKGEIRIASSRSLRDAVEILRKNVAGPRGRPRPGRLDPADLLEESLPGPGVDRGASCRGPHLALLAASDVLLVASGTATVEGLLASVPMVVVYRSIPLTLLDRRAAS